MERDYTWSHGRKQQKDSTSRLGRKQVNEENSTNEYGASIQFQSELVFFFEIRVRHHFPNSDVVSGYFFDIVFAVRRICGEIYFKKFNLGSSFMLVSLPYNRYLHGATH